MKTEKSERERESMKNNIPFTKRKHPNIFVATFIFIFVSHSSWTNVFLFFFSINNNNKRLIQIFTTVQKSFSYIHDMLLFIFFIF